jgi:uncharacterized protein (TIGR02687 family)
VNLEQIQAELETLFNSSHRFLHDGRRVIFWYDPDGEFGAVWDAVQIEHVRKLRHDGGWFKLKYDLHRTFAQDNVLVYAPFPEPPPQQNYLYDVQVTGLRFSADRAGMVWQMLGVRDRALEGFLRDHAKFLAAQARVDALRELRVPEGASLSVLRAAMLCAVARLRTLDAGLFVRELLKLGVMEDKNRLWLEVSKFFAAEELWEAIGDATGFRVPDDERPTLARLFNALAVTHLRRRWTVAFPKTLEHFVIRPDAAAVAITETWLRDSRDAGAWRALSRRAEESLNLGALAREAGGRAIRDADTFASLEQTVVRECAERLTNRGNAACEGVLELIASRRDSHWFAEFEVFYAALEAAARLLMFAPRWAALPTDAAALWSAYQSELHGVDRAYREFCAAFAALETNGADLLKPLSERLERVYTEDFLERLGGAWSDALTSFPPPGLPTQNNFYREVVQPALESSRVVVVISDALRFEIAVALQQRLEQEDGLELEIQARVTGLPSVTSVGMASLLPGSKVALQAENVVRDGAASNTTEARQRILEGVIPGARAIQEETLTRQKREEARAWLGAAALTYVYHNVIDTTGESAAQELDVPVAANKALEELTALVKRLTKQLNVSKVFVTADHGFLFQRRSLEEFEKLTADKTGEVISLSKRYVVGRDLSVPDGAQGFASALEGLQVVAPRGSLRFVSPGRGAQYVHGGSSLQEVIIPVLAVRPVRGKSADRARVRVALQHGGARRITGNPFTLTLIQEDPVSDRLHPREVRIAWFDSSGVPVTTELRLRFDSSDANASERVRREVVQVTLRDPDRTQSYDLVIRDVDDGTELLREAWRIDLAIPDDFGV